MKSILALTALIFASGYTYAGNGSGTMFPLTKIAYNQTETLTGTPAVDTATSTNEFIYFLKAEGELVKFNYISLVNNKWKLSVASASAQDLTRDRALAEAIALSQASHSWTSLGQ